MRAIALAVLTAACSGTTGTLAVDLATAPGSTVMDGVAALHVTISNPTEVHEVDRGDDGSFALDLDLTAGETSRAIAVDGVDAGGTVVAVGASPLLPVDAINAHVVIYMAAPLSIAASPSALSAARAESGIAALTYGAVVAGGRGTDGMASAVVDIYNVFDHSVVQALVLPEARARPIVAVATGNVVLIYGGIDPAGATRGTFEQLQTTVAPSGAYIDLGDHPDLARAGEAIAQTAAAGFTMSGEPAIEIAAGGDVGARTDIAQLPAAGAGTTLADGSLAALFAGAGAGDNGALLIHADAASPATGDATVTLPAVTAIPGADAFVLAGGTRAGAPVDDVVRVDATTGARTVVAHLATARAGAAIAATVRFVVVAGGTGGESTAEILDATTLLPVTAPQPLAVARVGATAIALSNGQVAIFGGAATATVELFTPPN